MVFAGQIQHITYGFYLFTALDVEQLATLMRLVSTAAIRLNCREVVLNFETLYRPGDERALCHYTDQLDRKRLRLGTELALEPSIDGSQATGLCTLFCP